MKTRNGFVSNSSSSSFIITKEDIPTMKEHDVEVFKVADIIKSISPIIDKINEQYRLINDLFSNCELPDYMEYTINDRYYGHPLISFLEELTEMIKDDPEIYITGAYDRDYAYQNNWDFPIYKGDI